MVKRDLDVVVFGASGVAGRQVASYLAERAPESGARWGAAARDPEKLARVLGAHGASAPETMVADVSDAASLAAMASRARVVLNAVGPFTSTARSVIHACIAAGAHYADLTGEIPFVRRVIDEFHAPAAAAGIKVVQLCGYEAVPADLSVLLAAEKAREQWGEPLAEAELMVHLKGPPGLLRPSDGGGIATMRSLLQVIADDDAVVMLDPAALITDGAATDVRALGPISPRVRVRDGTAIAPVIPFAFISPAVIHRTNALLAAERGDKFRAFDYREGMALRGGPLSLPFRIAAAGVLAGIQAAMARGARARPATKRRVARALSAALPSTAIDPPIERQRQWRWDMALRARTVTGNEVRVRVESEGHVGYLATGRIMGEAGLLLAEKGATPDRSGCLTPAVALGTRCVDRFGRARLHFSVAGLP